MFIEVFNGIAIHILDNHLNPDWEKWTMQEARDIFKEFNLTDKIWDLEKSAERF